MRAISERRRVVESERHDHSVKRGRRGWFHFENMPLLEKVFKSFVRVLHLRKIGYRNALDVRVEEVEFGFSDLPACFDGVRVLLVTDPHIDEFEALAGKVLELAGQVDYDFCVLGGDYNFGYRQESGLAYLRMKELADGLVGRSRVFGVLGNHDMYRMGEMLQECGVEMLVNDNACVERDGERLYVLGLDDCHYYDAADLALAGEGIEEGAFRIVACRYP